MTALEQICESAGVTLETGRAFMRELALLPTAEGDEVVADARRSLLRELSAEHRRQRAGARLR